MKECVLMPPLYTYGLNWREPPEDGEMNGMMLPSRHRIQNSSPDSQRPSTLPLGHTGSPQYIIFTNQGLSLQSRNKLHF